MEERPRRWRSGGGKVERREGSGPAADEAASARRRGEWRRMEAETEVEETDDGEARENETTISLAFSSGSCLMNRTICWTCLDISTSFMASIISANGGEIYKAIAKYLWL